MGFPLDTSQVKVKAEVRFDIKARKEEFVQHSEEWRIQIEETVKMKYFIKIRLYTMFFSHICQHKNVYVNMV